MVSSSLSDREFMSSRRSTLVCLHAVFSFSSCALRRGAPSVDLMRLLFVMGRLLVISFMLDAIIALGVVMTISTPACVSW